jgi:hypothetical protein
MMTEILADPNDIELAELHDLLKKLAALPSEFTSEQERRSDEQVMEWCVEHFRARRLARPIHIKLPEQRSPAWQASMLLLLARDLKVEGMVANHLSRATLEFACAKMERALPVNAGEHGDFRLGTTCFHVTAAPGSAVISKCKDNALSGLHPVLLVPRELVSKSRHLAEDANAANEITIIAIEDFVAANIIEISEGRQSEFFDTLKAIVTAYNRRLEEVETDMSLRIELK